MAATLDRVGDPRQVSVQGAGDLGVHASGNWANLSARQQGELHRLMRPSAQLATARALRLREDFQAFYH
jgi:hypothetical protein